MEICPECDGTGIDPEDGTSECWYCEGEIDCELESPELRYG